MSVPPLRSAPTNGASASKQALDLECDLDPMILRARQLRRQGSNPQARCLEQELLPLF